MRKFLALAAILALSISLMTGCRTNSEIDLNKVPNYLKEVYPILKSEGIKVSYNPYEPDNVKIVSHVSVPDLRNELKKNKFPASWVKTSIELPKNEIVETSYFSDTKNGYAVSTKRIFAGVGYKTVLDLYKIEKGVPHLSATLDKVPDVVNASGGSIGNFSPQINGNFVVWLAGYESDVIGNYHIWAYSINKREFFDVASSDDSPHDGCILDGSCNPLYHLYPDNKLIVQTVFKDATSNEVFTRIKLYDLNTKESEILVLSKDYNYIVEIGGYNSALANNILFVTRCKLYQTEEENKKFASFTDVANREIVQVDLKTKEISPLTPKYFIVYGSLDGKVLLLAFSPDYSYHDIWLYNPVNKTLECILKVPIGGVTDPMQYYLLTPDVYLLNRGLTFFRIGWDYIIPEYYFSFAKKKLFYLGNFIPSSDGNYLIVYGEASESEPPKETITYLLVQCG